MKKKWIMIGIIAIVILAVAVILAIVTTKKDDSTDTVEATELPDMRELVGKTISLSEGIKHFDDVVTDVSADEFSTVYGEAVTLHIESIDEEEMTVQMVVTAPPLRKILEECLPDDLTDYNTAFDTYTTDVYTAIRKCPESELVYETVKCGIVENNGLRIVPNNDLFNVVFPDIQQLLGEILIEMMSVQEG